MRRRFKIATFLGLLGAFGGHETVRAGSKRADELTRLVRQECGSCHGLTLKGGLGPALTPSTLRHKSTEAIAAIVLTGRPGTAMPPWNGLLDAEDAMWIARALKEGALEHD